MGLFDITDLVLQRGLQGAGQRQQVLANNLANANTAGFKRSDVDFQSSLAAALGAGSESGVANASFQTQTDTSSSMQADGNNVDVDQEMANMTQNSTEYEAMLAVVHARMQNIKTVLGGA
jgi:flagellar basal-body rod protein FlgB